MSDEPLLLYDYLHVRGGAERFSLDLIERWPGARLLVAGRAHALFQDDSRVDCLMARELPVSAALRVAAAAAAFRRARSRVSALPAVIYSGHYAPLALDPTSSQRRVYYAHSLPLPFLQGQEAARISASSSASGLALAGFGRWLRPRFARALQAMDVVFANSAFTAAALARWPGVTAEVLTPPCASEGFHWRPSEGYFLSFSRQEPQKRVIDVVKAFVRAPELQLVVASDGSEHERLRQAAAGCSNIRFIRSTDPDCLRGLIESSLATLHFGKDEPFGMSAVESCAAGKPVVAVMSGGLAEIVIPHVTGWLLSADPGTDEVVRQLRQITQSDCLAMQPACERSAKDYSWSASIDRMRRALGH